jgi:hypothetical protein
MVKNSSFFSLSTILTYNPTTEGQDQFILLIIHNIHEAPILLLSKNCEVGANFTFFYEAELLKLEVLDICKVELKLVKLRNLKQVLISFKDSSNSTTEQLRSEVLE